jgi:hypothetical protein
MLQRYFEIIPSVNRTAVKKTVDFYFRHGQPLQPRKRRKAGAEIVYGQTESLDPQAGQRVEQFKRGMHRRRLRDFKYQSVSRHMLGAAQSRNAIGQCLIAQIAGRQIDRHI